MNKTKPTRTVLRQLLVLFSALLCFLPQSPALGDELVIDETLTETQTLGDFDVSHCVRPITLTDNNLFNEQGEISVGKLYSFFKSQGIDSMNRLNLVLDLDPNQLRSDFQLDSFSLEILGNENSPAIKDLYSLGIENSLMLPAYENSSFRPEAQIAIQLHYDFMQQFNADSTETIKVQFSTDAGHAAIPVRIGVLTSDVVSSPLRASFLIAFIAFWLVVFAVLFRITTPKLQNTASVA